MPNQQNLSNTSTGGAGYNAINSKGGAGRVSIPVKIPNREHPYPWPLPESAYQGSVGGAGGLGLVARPRGPYYSPFTQPYLRNWPWKENRQGWLNLAIPCRE